MSYKYDQYDGVTMQNQIGADIEDINPEIVSTVNPIKKLDSSNVREAINLIALKEKNETKENKEMENEKDIKITVNPNLVSEIKADMGDEFEDNRKNITITKNEDDERELA
jgi:hypothetical protein